MVNTINTLTERNKELLTKIEELEKKYEPLHNQRVFIEKMIERGDKYRMRLRGDNPWWNNPNDYYSTERCNFFEILFGSGNSCPSDLEPFIWKLITSHCELERIKVQQSYCLDKSGSEKKQLTEEVNNLNNELNHWKPRAEDAEQKAKELEVELKEAEEGRECNLDAIKKCEEWERREKGKLKEEIDNKQTLLKESFDEYVKKDRELRTTNKWLEESQQNLRENRKEGLQKDEKIKRLEEQLSLANKPLPKRPNKIKLFRKEIKTKLHQFTQKFKLQKQTMVAQIEVPVKK